MIYDREFFFNSVRFNPFDGALSQSQVNGMNYLLDVWEIKFSEQHEADVDRMYLAYALATVFHETSAKMVPLEEYGKGDGYSYGEPTGPYNQIYYGRGHVQLTWEENYIKGQENLLERYNLDVPMHHYPHRMLEDETSALILYDGMLFGWFTGARLSKFFNKDKEDPYNARTIINGHDKAELIETYYWAFKDALMENQNG